MSNKKMQGAKLITPCQVWENKLYVFLSKLLSYSLNTVINLLSSLSLKRFNFIRMLSPDRSICLRIFANFVLFIFN